MSDTNDPSVKQFDSEGLPRTGADSTNSVGLAARQYGEDDDPLHDYIEIAQSSGSACRHLNRARRHRYVSRAPDRFDE